MRAASEAELWELHVRALAEFGAALRRAPDARVPAYPSWVVRDLAVHLVGVHTMAATAIETAASSRPGFDNLADGRTDVDELLSELSESRERLDRALASTDLERVWVIRPDRRPHDWRRRMLMEAELHRYDAEQASGTPRFPTRELALEGIDEFLQTHGLRSLPEEGLAGLIDVRTEGGSWRVDLARATVTAGHESDVPPADGLLRGTAPAIWLWCNLRTQLPTPVHLEDRNGTLARYIVILSTLRRPSR